MFLKRIFKRKNALAGKEALIKMNKHILDQQIQINRLITDLVMVKAERDFLLEENNLLKNRQIKASKKKKYKLVDAIAEIFQETSEELTAAQVLEKLKWKRLDVRKPTTRSLNPTFHYMVRIHKLLPGKNRGTFKRYKK